MGFTKKQNPLKSLKLGKFRPFKINDKIYFKETIYLNIKQANTLVWFISNSDQDDDELLQNNLHINSDTILIYKNEDKTYHYFIEDSNGNFSKSWLPWKFEKKWLENNINLWEFES